MSQPDVNDILEAEARVLALELDLPDVAVLKIFPALSTAYFLGRTHGSDHVLQCVKEHFRIQADD